MSAEDIKVIARLVSDLCGIVLDETKGYLVESRLSALAQELGCTTFSELYYKARYDTNSTITTRIIDAITTNETLFFRDNSPFEALQHKVLPELFDEKLQAGRQKRLRFWSAACSTGQEPYSIAMILCELLPDIDKWDVQVTASDISDAAIQRASRGRFEEHEIKRGMRADLLRKYFTPVDGGWQVSDRLRALVSFNRTNLLQPFGLSGAFDVIFCRNVAIYFSPTDRRDLFLRLAERLAPTGVLFVGSSESLTDLGPQFRPHHHCRAVYYRPNLPAAVMTG